MQNRKQVIASLVLAATVVAALYVTIRTVYLNGVQTFPGQIETTQRVSLNFQNPGRLMSLKIRPGDRVTAGEVLAVQDQQVAQLTVNAAQALLDADRLRVQALQQPQLTAAEQQQVALEVQKARGALNGAQQASGDAQQLATATTAQAQAIASAAAQTLASDQQAYTRNCPNGVVMPPGLQQILGQSSTAGVASDTANVSGPSPTVTLTPFPGPTPPPTSVELTQYLACQRMADGMFRDQQLVTQYSSDVPRQQALAQQYRDVTAQAVNNAQTALSIAENDGALRNEPGTPADIAAAQAKVADDAASVALDQKALADVVVTSPVDGVVTQVNANVGDLVGLDGVRNYAEPQGLPQALPQFSLFPPAPSSAASNGGVTDSFAPLISVQEDSGWQIVAQVPESAVSTLRPGLHAEVSIPALNRIVRAHVVETVPVPVTVQGAVDYQVVLAPDAAVAGWLPGMSCTVSAGEEGQA